MVEETIEVQTLAEVQQIDNRREIQNTLDNQISEQTNVINTINNQLESISTNIDNIQVSDIDLTDVTDKIDKFDTEMITTQNQDIIETLGKQQNKINSIEEKLNTILNKLDEM